MPSVEQHQAVLLELLKEFDRVCKKHGIKYFLFAGSALGAVRHQGFIPWDDDLDVALFRQDYEKLMRLPATEWNNAYYFQREFSQHWPMFFSKLRKNNTTCLEKYHPKDKQIHQGIYIDVFPIDGAYANPILRKVQYYASRVVVAKALDRRGYETDSKKKKIVMVLCRMLPMKPFLRMVKKQGETELVHSFLGATSSYQKGIYRRQWLEKSVMMDFEDGKFPVPGDHDAILRTMYGDYMRLPDENQRQIKKHALLVDTQQDYTKYEHYRDGMHFTVYTRSIR